MIIRPEKPEDIPHIHKIEALAFDHEAEADLVDLLRANGKVTLSLVAEIEGQIVGHILFSPVKLETRNGSVTGQGLAPLAVHPGFQNQGIGSALSKAGIEQLRQADHAWVVVEGSPKYYPRFGFTDAEPFGITCQFDPPPGCFMIMELKPGTLTDLHGIIYFAEEFLSVG